VLPDTTVSPANNAPNDCNFGISLTSEGAVIDHPLPRVCAQSTPQIPVAEHTRDRPGQAVDVTDGKQQARHAMLDELGNAAGIRGHHRATCGLGLEHDQAETFDVTRENTHVADAQELAHILSEAEELRSRAKKPAREIEQVLCERRTLLFRTAGQHETYVAQIVGEARNCADQILQSLRRLIP
jgi:hypothetical protein